MGDGSQEPAYKGVMAELRELIADLPPDTELPSIRAKAGELGLGVAVVRRAYEKLRDDEGLLVSNQGGRFFTLPPRPLEPDEITEIMRRFDVLTGEVRTLAERVAALESARAAAPASSASRSRRRSHPAAP